VSLVARLASHASRLPVSPSVVLCRTPLVFFLFVSRVARLSRHVFVSRPCPSARARAHGTRHTSSPQRCATRAFPRDTAHPLFAHPAHPFAPFFHFLLPVSSLFFFFSIDPLQLVIFAFLRPSLPPSLSSFAGRPPLGVCECRCTAHNATHITLKQFLITTPQLLGNARLPQSPPAPLPSSRP